MEVLIQFFILLVSCIAIGYVVKFNNKLKKFDNELETIKKRLNHLAENNPPVMNAAPQEQSIEFTPSVSVSAETIEKKKTAIPSGKTALIKKLEINFLENWTGILGSLIVVVGLSFLGVFAALNMSPFFRFILLTAVAVILTLIFYIIRKKEKIRKIALWLRSIAGAVFLFACLGAGGIPGLKWIDDQYMALALLIFGIAANIFLAYAGGSQAAASLHVVLSLLTLFIAPQNWIIYVIAVIITLNGVILTYREKWEFQLLLTITVFFIYIVWYYISRLAVLNPAHMPLSEKLTGIGGIALIHILSHLLHYRQIYADKGSYAKPLIAHCANWLFFGIGMYLYAPNISWVSIPVCIIALGAVYLAQRAKALGIRWLYVTDILMSQAVMYVSIIALLKWEVTLFPVSGLLFIEVLVFLTITVLQKDTLLFEIGNFVLGISAVAVMINHSSTIDFDNIRSYMEHAIVLLICLSTLTVFHIYTQRKIKSQFTFKTPGVEKRILKFHLPLQGFIIACLFLPFYFIFYFTHYNSLPDLPWYISPDYLLLIFMLALIVIREKIQSPGLGIGGFAVLLIVHGTAWIKLASFTDIPFYFKLISVIPLLIADCFLAKYAFVEKKKKYVRMPGIYLLFLHLAVVSYLIVEPFSPFIPGIAWLLLSLVSLESANFIRRRSGKDIVEQGESDRYLLHTGYLLIAAFIVRHLAVHLQSEKYIVLFNVELIRVRLAIEIFALCIFVYWGFSQIPADGKIYKTQRLLHPLFPELIVTFLLLTLVVEVKQIYLPLVWIVLGIICFFTGKKFQAQFARFTFYSLLLFWASCFHVAFVTSPAVTPSLQFYDQAWVFAVLAILIQFCYIILFYKSGKMEQDGFPVLLKKLEQWVIIIEKRRNLWVYYPLFITIALFLFWSFDKSILTLLFSMEAFAIFVLSLILKENHFRYLSLLGLVLCLFRLVFFDLAGSGTLVKAIVFIAVGGLLLLMNMLYNKFKDRFSK